MFLMFHRGDKIDFLEIRGKNIGKEFALLFGSWTLYVVFEVMMVRMISKGNGGVRNRLKSITKVIMDNETQPEIHLFPFVTLLEVGFKT